MFIIVCCDTPFALMVLNLISFFIFFIVETTKIRRFHHFLMGVFLQLLFNSFKYVFFNCFKGAANPYPACVLRF